MKLWPLTIHLIALSSTAFCQNYVTRLCTPETIIFPLNVTSQTDEFGQSNDLSAPLSNQANCECHWENSHPWGQIVLKISCQEMQFESKLFEAEELPPLTDSLDLSWNKFDFVPQLIGNDLSELDMSHNAITTIDDNNFSKIPNLKKINLASNSIMLLSINAFAKLKKLEMLDLSKNQLRMVTVNVFSPLSNLRHLILSRNRHINDTLGNPNVNLYLSLGVVPTLEILEIEGSNLDFIDMANGVGLRELRLKGNAFQNIPDIPRGLEVLDLSRNPIITMQPKCLPHLGNLVSLFMNDMPHLTSVQDHALFGLPNLKHLSFQGSWNLSEFSSMAFGSCITDNITKLEILNLRGTGLKTLNESIALHLGQIQMLDLNGDPLNCDCNLKWIIDLNVETNGKCVKPLELRGRRLSNVKESDLKCKKWPQWVYTMLNGLLVLLLMIISIICTWFLVMGLKPLRQIRSHKVGMASPYARITIEPNRGEELR